MPVCQVMYKETLTSALRILLMALQFSSLPSWAAPAFSLVGAAQMAMNTLLVIALVSVFIAVIVVIVRPHALANGMRSSTTRQTR